MFLRLCNEMSGRSPHINMATPTSRHIAAKGNVSLIFSILLQLHLLAYPFIPYLLVPSPLPLYLQSISLSAPWTSTPPCSMTKHPPLTQKYVFGSLSPSILPLQFSLTNLLLSQGFLDFPCFFNHHSNDLHNTHTALSMGLAARPHPSQRRRRWNATNKT